MRIVAVTSCPTGIAHTYMAAEALEQAARAAGHEIKVETQGAAGAEPLPPQDIAAADAVVLPSTWEGFGAPLIEASMHRRPLAVGDYPVAAELAAFGFRWFPVHDPGPLRDFLDRPDAELLEHNREVAVRHFSLDALTTQLADLFHGASWDDLLG